MIKNVSILVILSLSTFLCNGQSNVDRSAQLEEVALKIDGQFDLFIPVTEVTNSTTQSNWEHSGVSIMEEAEDEKAKQIAHLRALEGLIKNSIQSELTSEELSQLIKNLTQNLND